MLLLVEDFKRGQLAHSFAGIHPWLINSGAPNTELVMA
jgi:hypothetical protein